MSWRKRHKTNYRLRDKKLRSKGIRWSRVIRKSVNKKLRSVVMR